MSYTMIPTHATTATGEMLATVGKLASAARYVCGITMNPIVRIAILWISSRKERQ